MELREIQSEFDGIVDRYGPWTAHNIRLAEGLYTMSSAPVGDETKLRRVTQLVSDLYGGDLTGLRVLDLACLEGMYALEFATRGATVVAIEGREANIEKARFAARVHGVDRVEFELGDVRALSQERHGEFDVVLCLGILYHLAAEDIFAFVGRLAEVCRRAVIVDTAVSLRGAEERSFGGHSYRGETVVEHDASATEEERLKAVWSSLDNPTAFALTQPSLLRLLGRAGFTSALECKVPAEPKKAMHRVTLAALRGNPVSHLITPEPDVGPHDVPERVALGAWLPQAQVWSSGRHLVPRPLRGRVRRLLGSETRRH